MLTFDKEIAFSAESVEEVLLRNFWPPEAGFVWSTGRWCEVHFAFDHGAKPVAQVDLMLDADVFKSPDKFEGQNLAVYLNGSRIGSSFCKARTTLICLFESNLLRKLDNVLTIDTPDSTRPSQFGSADDRVLGAQLFSLQFRRAG